MLTQQLIGPAQRERYALVVSGSPQGIAPELVARLAREAAFIVAVDSGGDVLCSAGFMPHLLLGDFDSIQHETLAACRAAGVELAAYDAHKDATDLEIALEELRRRQFSSVVATNVLGGRIDHELASLGCLAAAAERGAAIAIIEERQSGVFLNTEGVRDSLQLEFSQVALAPSCISLIPWGGKATVSISGVKWELDHAELAPSSSLGVSNVPVGKRVCVKTHAGTVLAVLIV
jgi:thiamine pyrophosphokinase